VSASNPSDVVRKSIIVRCALDRAFRTWTEQIDAWWPKRHSHSGNPGTTVLMERGLGGRIYERTPEGVEHDWGRVIAWDPPRHLAYHWYLGSGPEQPTRVEVHFIAQDEANTRVDVSHRGPELIGALWPSRSSVFDGAWGAVLLAYGSACDA
jgi:uncharacterized protein YndB with AHSA1/START domain